MNSIIISIGSIDIRWYSVLILLGVCVGWILCTSEAKKFGIPKEYMTNLFFYIILFGIIGARLYFVAFDWEYYSHNLSSIYKIWEGGLAIHGGIIAGLIVTIVYTKKYKVRTFRIMDILVVGLIIAQAIGRWGNFMNGEAHGDVVSLEFLQSLHLPQFIIDGMNINGFYYQPTFLYESVLCFIGFIILLIFRRREHTKIGQTTCLYLMWYGVVRFFVESMRTDSLMLGNLRMAQLISILMFAVGLVIYILLNKGSKLENKYNDMELIENVRF